MNNLRLDINRLASEGVPFLFIIDFDMERPLLWPLYKVPPGIRYSFPGMPDKSSERAKPEPHRLNPRPVSFDTYAIAFEKVQQHIAHGNSYLLNLTFPSDIEPGYSLEEIYLMSRAKYRLLVQDRFVVFSPETFVTISDSFIRTYPMKGTIDASEEDALEHIMNDDKELAEHNTIIDLLRNDLSIIADEVKVTRYRYPDYIKTGNRELIQISSEIEGRLPGDWKSSLGDILLSMLPAGSVSGAPKEMTVKIIHDSEIDRRGYYTGVFGLFDGETVDSAVMIRYIEQKGDRYVYRSGGGITFMSELRKEYDELISKVYVPFG